MYSKRQKNLLTGVALDDVNNQSKQFSVAVMLDTAIVGLMQGPKHQQSMEFLR